jgi:hypothetical protein
MKNLAKHQSLLELSEKIAYVVTDLNGLISSIVNEEVMASDFNDDLTQLFDKLNQVERAVSELTGVFWSEQC